MTPVQPGTSPVRGVGWIGIVVATGLVWMVVAWLVFAGIECAKSDLKIMTGD